MEEKSRKIWTFFCSFEHCVMVPTFLLQNIYHPRTSESLPPNYNMPPERRPELHQRIRVIRHDDVRTGSGESRSELLIQQTSPNDNGTYYCEAVNKAASSVSNFTLHVTDSVDAPTILQVRNFTVVENQSKSLISRKNTQFSENWLDGVYLPFSRFFNFQHFFEKSTIWIQKWDICIDFQPMWVSALSDQPEKSCRIGGAKMLCTSLLRVIEIKKCIIGAKNSRTLW